MQVVPTGLRCEIGRFAGDACPATNLLAAAADYVITHPNAVEVLDFGVSTTGVPYLVMELLRGRTLATLLRDGRKLPLQRTVEIIAPVCDALAAFGLEFNETPITPERIVQAIRGVRPDIFTPMPRAHM